jgi:hypothetical protein
LPATSFTSTKTKQSKQNTAGNGTHLPCAILEGKLDLLKMLGIKEKWYAR